MVLITAIFCLCSLSIRYCRGHHNSYMLVSTSMCNAYSWYSEYSSYGIQLESLSSPHKRLGPLPITMFPPGPGPGAGAGWAVAVCNRLCLIVYFQLSARFTLAHFTSCSTIFRMQYYFIFMSDVCSNFYPSAFLPKKKKEEVADN